MADRRHPAVAIGLKITAEFYPSVKLNSISRFNWMDAAKASAALSTKERLRVQYMLRIHSR